MAAKIINHPNMFPPIEDTPAGGGGGDNGDMDDTRLTALETKWNAVVPTLSTKSDLAELRTDIHKMDASIKTWMLGTIVGLFIGFGGLFLAMSNALKPLPPSPQSAVAQPAPIIIQVPAQATPAVPKP